MPQKIYIKSVGVCQIHVATFNDQLMVSEKTLFRDDRLHVHVTTIALLSESVRAKICYCFNINMYICKQAQCRVCSPLLTHRELSQAGGAKANNAIDETSKLQVDYMSNRSRVYYMLCHYITQKQKASYPRFISGVPPTPDLYLIYIQGRRLEPFGNN